MSRSRLATVYPSTVPAETVDIAILHAVQKLGYDRPTPEQAVDVREFLLGKDVFVSLPTGGGKSLCYASLPLAFDYLLHAAIIGKCFQL